MKRQIEKLFRKNSLKIYGNFFTFPKKKKNANATPINHHDNS
jgi:hypothetical protein